MSFMFRFPNDFASEFDRMQRQLDDAFRAFGLPASIRATGRGVFPTLNVGTTDDTIEIVAFAPGVDPQKLEVSVDKGVLTIDGERAAATPATGESGGTNVTVHARERFSGKFRRVINLPKDADPDQVEARYVDGCLRVSVKKRESSKPRQIQVN
jgi:HSP20 family protein